MKNAFMRYRFVGLALLALGGLYLFNHEMGLRAIDVTLFSFEEMILVIPPVFILLGLLDVWIPKETMTRFMGDKSGVRGIVLSFVVGAAAAGPLYGAFPVAAVFMKKGVKFSNILIFIGAWSTMKIPMFIFELTALGPVFAITRMLINIPGILIIAHIISRRLSPDEVNRIYEAAPF
ncbi:permease [Fusibacter tunisiensis]|uniref:Uncharacterized membrane protein YraQ (UPF0718 family) n=1 Tax=Fusibacter tunisiensis TaxID=1008308 RepID=A0ABS2MRS8_9FIRM|nr:permease [Fusibacter tunisiensis]MBM7562095.1 uncharacterized membrane protein YraQ (UPF0718 family) [Fusibacter tunisiensis]